MKRTIGFHSHPGFLPRRNTSMRMTNMTASGSGSIPTTEKRFCEEGK